MSTPQKLLGPIAAAPISATPKNAVKPQQSISWTNNGGTQVFPGRRRAIEVRGARTSSYWEGSAVFSFGKVRSRNTRKNSTAQRSTWGVRRLRGFEQLEHRRLLSIIDLGTLPGGSSSEAYGINNSGQVAGIADTASEPYHAFLYSNGAMTDLGTLGPLPFCWVGGINDSGQVVGTAGTAWRQTNAFLYSNGTMTNLGTLGGYDSSASGINDCGQVVGWANYDNASHLGHAFLYSNGAMTDLGSPFGGTSSEADGINDHGQVVGGAYTASGDEHAFLYSDGKMIDLGSLGGTLAWALGINDSGQVVVESETASGDHAFLYSDGKMTDLAALGGTNAWVSGINDSGQVVGWAQTSSGDKHAFLYSNGTMTDLNDLLPADSGWILDSANAINNQGQIVGSGSHNGVERAFLMGRTITDTVVGVDPTSGTPVTGDYKTEATISLNVTFDTRG